MSKDFNGPTSFSQEGYRVRRGVRGEGGNRGIRIGKMKAVINFSLLSEQNIKTTYYLKLHNDYVHSGNCRKC